MVQQREGIRADGVEPAVAQDQQAGKADHHVQSKAENDIDHRQGGDIHRTARHHKRPGHGNHQQGYQEQLLLHRRAVNRRHNKLRPGDVLNRFLEQRPQQLEEKDHRGADKDPLPANIGGGIDYQLGAVQLQLHAHKDARQNEEHHGRQQRHCNLHRFHTFSTSGRPRMPVGITNSTRISSAKETTSLYSVLR